MTDAYSTESEQKLNSCMQLKFYRSDEKSSEIIDKILSKQPKPKQQISLTANQDTTYFYSFKAIQIYIFDGCPSS